jgi:hypothetical protein
VFFTGDWLGAAIVTGIGTGAMFVLSLLGTLIATTSGRGSQLFGQVFLYIAMAAGGSASFEGFDGDLSFRPLTLTLVGYGAMAFFFLRRLRTQGPVTLPALGLQAGRLAAVHAGALLVIALLSFVGAGDFGMKADVITTLIFGTVTLAIALFVATLLGLPNLAPGKVEQYRTLLAGPVRATLFLTVAACAAFGVAFILLAVIDGGDLTDDPVAFIRSVLALILLMLPNVAGFGTLLGLGVPLSIGGSGFGSAVEESVTILDAVDGEPMLWIVPIIALGLLVATGWYSARHSPIAANGRPVGWWLAAVLPVALFVLALSVSVSGGFGGAGLGGLSFGGDFDLFFVLLLGAVYGIGAGMLGTLLVPRRPPAYPPGYGPYPQTASGYPPAGYPTGYPAGYAPTAPMPPAAPVPPAAPFPPPAPFTPPTQATPEPPTTLAPPTPPGPPNSPG